MRKAEVSGYISQELKSAIRFQTGLQTDWCITKGTFQAQKIRAPRFAAAQSASKLPSISLPAASQFPGGFPPPM
jgi:hypothetical protein